MFQMDIQKIEWVRRAASEMPCGQAGLPFQPLIQEVVAMNERIMYEKESNKHWYSDWSVTDRWNFVNEIPVPCAPQERK